MTSAVLYGTTSDNELRPVQVTDSGEFVTDGGGGGDWYENFYVGGTEGAPSISLLSDGAITAPGDLDLGLNLVLRGDGAIYTLDGNGYSFSPDGTLTTEGDVYARNFIPSSGFDLNKIGQALSTIYDVIDTVDDLQGLKNLFHLLLDNLKSDPSSPAPEPQGLPEPTEPSE